MCDANISKNEQPHRSEAARVKQREDSNGEAEPRMKNRNN